MGVAYLSDLLCRGVAMTDEAVEESRDHLPHYVTQVAQDCQELIIL